MENQDHATIGDGMTQEREAKILEGAIEKWGATAQVVVAIEELSELQKELCKHARGKDNLESIADEIADVQIMLEQMMVLHDCHQVVMEHKAAKLKRLADRIESAEAALAGKGGKSDA